MTLNTSDTQKISIRNAKFAKLGLIDLCDYIGDMSQFKMAEIGCYVGDSTEIFLPRVKWCFCIDPWENGYDPNDGASEGIEMSIVEKQFNQLRNNYDNFTKYKCKSNEAAYIFDDGFLDLVYIDGLHTYDGVKNDIELYKSKIKKGGYLAGHDYGSKHFLGVKDAVDEFCTPDATFKDSSWIVKI